jgi:polysaccharide export outer membrane protein
VHFLLLVLILGAPAAHAADSVLPAAPPPAANDDYRIGAGDTIRVNVFDEPGLSGSAPVRQDGNVSLQLLGNVFVRGMTVAEAAARIAELYGSCCLQVPYLTLTIEAYGSRQVRIFGGIKQPGSYGLSQPTTILDLIGKAGGLSDPDIKAIKVYRADGSVVTLQVADVMSGKSDLVVADGDTVEILKVEKVYLTGQVKNPGAVAFSEDLTVSRALILAGDVSSSAALSRVEVMRADGTVQKVNIARVRRGKTADLKLEPGDTITVRESPFK